MSSITTSSRPSYSPQVATGKVGIHLQRWSVFFVVVLILSMGFFLRFDDLEGVRGMGHSEVYTPGIDIPEGKFHPSSRLTLMKTLKDLLREPHPPAWYIGMSGWINQVGNDLVFMRVPSVFFGVGCIILVYVLGRLETNKTAALVGAGLLAFNGFHIYWSQFSRPITMACFVGLLSTIFLLQVVRGHSRHLGWLSFLYVSVTVVGLSTLYYFWLIFVAQVLWVLVNGWVRKTFPEGLLRLQLLVGILSSPIVTLAILQALRQNRQSHLDTDIWTFLGEYFSFGFLFVPHVDAPPAILPSLVMGVIPILGIGLWFLGLRSKKRRQTEVFLEKPVGPNLLIISLATVWAVFFILGFSGFSVFADDRGPLLRFLLPFTGSIPLVLFLLVIFMKLYSPSLQKVGVLLQKKGILSAKTYSLTSFLSIVPILLVAFITMFMPFLASRHALLFVPYLLLVVASGAVGFVRYHKFRKFSYGMLAATLVVLGSLHFASIEYYQRIPSDSPTDYKGLAVQWIPEIKKSDLVMMQLHWAPAPIFYYLNHRNYQIVTEEFSEAVHRVSSPRVWVMSFEDHPLEPEMVEALKGLSPLRSIEARRIKVELFGEKPSDSLVVGSRK